ncbi:uncharacterized protein LOC116351315 [Contarinia nasturtii]|uniref:uncharacterized protein LOC116351315 n=1 Tax=Contarinia nasturtii TaxID=265458 RepID=UPI0012D39DF2|nr:uncharacterized protein LOC116351315 [Contarinia nasturtii]
MEMIINIVEHTKQLSIKLVQNNCNGNNDIFENIKKGTGHVLDKLNEIKNMKRLKKNIRKNPLFVEPVEKSIGLKWKNAKIDPETEIPDHGLIQSTFQYVPILETLRSVLANKDFYEAYVKYNLHQKHKCVPGNYAGFCCGSIHRSIEIFKDPCTLQIQIGSDDFEVCCAVKSKATKHKVNATYFQIINMPAEFRSKLNNIYLVALCSTVNFKTDEYDYNHIAELISNEICTLECDGIAIETKVLKESNINIGIERLKGTLTNVAVDNLGASGVMGFVESFSATYYCRHCECTKTECQTMTKEAKRKRRKIEKYEHHVKIAEKKNVKQDFIATMGVKRKCKLNDLTYFHILDNMSLDLMHDVNEGAIPYCLHDFFDLIVKKNKIISEAEAQQRIRDFNYGPTSKYNRPSLTNLEKHNLNQNASQLYCMIVNLPFIFVDFKNQFEKYWQPVQTLLKCMQILYSPEISENDVKSLEKFIQQHLKSVQDVFNRTLTPKHHFLVHYPEYIRKMGPPIHHWTMRLESKHRVLTEISRRKMNFGNLPKTLATEHQDRMCKKPSFRTEIKPSKSFGQSSKTMQFQRYESILKRDIGPKYLESKVHHFAAYDSIEYRQSGLIIENGRIYEINHILSIESNVYLLCHLNKICRKDKFSNSIVIEKIHDSAIVFDFNQLENKLVFDKIYSRGEYFVIADKLVVANLI